MRGNLFIHVQPVFWASVWKYYLAQISVSSAVGWLMLTFGLSILLLVVFLVLEWARQFLFQRLHVRHGIEAFYEKIGNE